MLLLDSRVLAEQKKQRAASRIKTVVEQSRAKHARSSFADEDGNQAWRGDNLVFFIYGVNAKTESLSKVTEYWWFQLVLRCSLSRTRSQERKQEQ